VYAAVQLGELDVLGACRESGADEASGLARLRDAFQRGERLTAILRRVVDDFGPEEFDVTGGLADAAEPLLDTAARALSDRFGAELGRLFSDHRDVFTALAAAGHALPSELQLPAQLALARRLEAELVALADGFDRATLAAAAGVVDEAAEVSVSLDTPAVRAAAEAAVEGLARRAALTGRAVDVDAAVAVLDVVRRAGVPVGVEVAQEVVYDALLAGGAGADLEVLGAALGLAVDRLGAPT
jgi:hypothetical protein